MARRLESELSTFERERERLEREHKGKFALIKGNSVIGTYDTFETAARMGLRRFRRAEFMIRQIGVPEPTVSPAVIDGLTGASLKSRISE